MVGVVASSLRRLMAKIMKKDSTGGRKRKYMVESSFWAGLHRGLLTFVVWGESKAGAKVQRVA